MSSLAQEESRSISENVTWGQRKRFADGKVSVPYGRFLGYDRGEDGNLVVNEAEAVIIRRIYSLFLEGLTPYVIAKKLTAEHIPTPGGKTIWRGSTVRSILQNEKYKGDALLQKRFIVDFLTKKQKVNEGEVPQYYVLQSHPYIIEPEEFDLVQAEMMKRKNQSHIGAFSSKIICGDCSSFFGSKVWHSNSKYRRVIWQCNSKFKGYSPQCGEMSRRDRGDGSRLGKQFCTTPHLYEKEIQQSFLYAFGQYFKRKRIVLKTLESVIEELKKPTEEEQNIVHEFDIATAELSRFVKENSEGQNHYDTDFEQLNSRYEKLAVEVERIEAEQLKMYRKRYPTYRLRLPFHKTNDAPHQNGVHRF